MRKQTYPQPFGKTGSQFSQKALALLATLKLEREINFKRRAIGFLHSKKLADKQASFLF